MNKARAAASRTILLATIVGAAFPACSKRPAATFEVVEPPAPTIESITHGSPGGARAGDTVSITMKGDSGLQASANLGALTSNVKLAEDASEHGLYHGNFKIPDGKTGLYDLTGRLSASSDRFATAQGPPLTVLGEVVPPKRDDTATDLNALRLLKSIYFDLDKSDLRQDARETLVGNAEVLKAHSRMKLIIEGHCDERGTNEYNMSLGDRRANAARDFLVASGVPAGRIRTISYGEEKPAETGRNEDAWAKNRRCEFEFED
jgi:peptidoglycan-associated lipoprotein